jgi:ketosteroid isomerase-like protein
MHATIGRLRDAINAHDPSAMTAVIAPEYRSEQPAHPNRGFSGRDQVDKNWSLLFTGVPDLRAEVLTAVDDGTTSFSEWEFLGHYGDGAVFHERGIMLLRLRDDLIASARMYFEEVEEDGADIDETMRQSARVDAASEPGG